MKGNGNCNDENNNCGCEWDGGDCCRITSNANTWYCSDCECLELIGNDGNDFLSIHNGGSDDSELVAKLTGTMGETNISIPGNQMFVVFNTNEVNVRKGFHALIMESMYFDINYPKIDIELSIDGTIFKFFIDDYCQYWLNTDDGILTSPNFKINNIGFLQHYYDNNLNCSWILNANQGHYITLEFIYFYVKTMIQMTYLLTILLIKFIILGFSG